MPRRALLRVAARALSRTVPRPTPLPTLARGARAAAAAPRRLPTLPALARCFAASSAAAHGAPEAPDTDPSAGAAASVLSEVDYHRLADETLDTLCEDLEDYLEALDCDGYDISLAMGVLTVDLGGGRGTYVVNKQGPNRQLWLSSPQSGPSRFDWDGEGAQWVYGVTGVRLHEILASELEAAMGMAPDLH